MKNMVKIAIAAVAAQACLAAAVSAGTAWQPVEVDMAVNVAVDAPAGSLSDAAEAISAASASGNDSKAQELLSELFSGGVKAGKAEPVAASKCCCVHHSTAAPAEVVAVSTAAAPAAAPAVAAAITPVVLAEEFAAAAAKKEAAAKEAAKKEKEEAQAQKAFAWGVTIMTVALIFLIILL